ncbi:MAG: J domain-containing protein [Actinobacteria bacterium]|nr:J domain-containing protein [Actinomycetota bacterium]
MTSPFDALGLAADAGLTDDDVRAAWRRVATATHPDRADGGDPDAFAAAAAAYTLLRTRTGRGEVLADLRDPAGDRVRTKPVPRKNRLTTTAATIAWQLAHGRPRRLALRLLGATAAGVIAVAAIGWQPASAAVITGALTWLLRTARTDLAGPP